MAEQHFSTVVMQPHDTPLSQLLAKHRHLLGELAKSLPNSLLFPIHPCHCPIYMPKQHQEGHHWQDGLMELKKNISSCTILPPTIQEGFLLRPVAIEGAQLQPMPLRILQTMLPFLKEKALQDDEIPTGFIFGYVERGDWKRAESAMNRLQDTGDTVELRVFRLRKVDYSWQEEALPSTIRWTMAPPQWVKLGRKKP